jgi:hypothetical protein
MNTLLGEGTESDSRGTSPMPVEAEPTLPRSCQVMLILYLRRDLR